MNKSGPVVVVHDNSTENDLLKELFRKLGYCNEIIFFSHPRFALEYLRSPGVHPFLIISEMASPLIDGMQLRTLIFNDKVLKKKHTPYLVFASDIPHEKVDTLYERSVQGVFLKPSDSREMETSLARMIDYWSHCIDD